MALYNFQSSSSKKASSESGITTICIFFSYLNFFANSFHETTLAGIVFPYSVFLFNLFLLLLSNKSKTISRDKIAIIAITI